jgi:hypothetical protein
MSYQIIKWALSRRWVHLSCIPSTKLTGLDFILDMNAVIFPFPERHRIFGFLSFRLEHFLFPKRIFFYDTICLNVHTEKKRQMCNDFRIRVGVDVKTVSMTKRSRVRRPRAICSRYLLIHAIMYNIDVRLEISRFILLWGRVSNVTNKQIKYTCGKIIVQKLP